jgi:hypothetical protein
MILIDFFSREACKYTEMVEGWYFYSDVDDSIMGGPFKSQEEAEDAAFGKKD